MKLHVAYVGICGSDIQRLDMGQPLASLGHEIIGSDGDAFYAVNPLMACGSCIYCHAGTTRFCLALASLGKDGYGGFAGGEIDVPSANLVRLDSNERAHVLADPVACVVHGISLLTVIPGQKIVVIGDGTMALLFTELLIQRGASVVQAIKDGSRTKRAHPQATIVSFGDLEPDSSDTAIICVGGTRAAVLNTAAQAVTASGTVLVVGAYHYLEDALDIKTFLKKEVTLKGTFSYEPSDFNEAITFISCNIAFFEAMIGDTFPSTELDAAVHHHRTSNNRHKVVVSFPAS